MSPENQTELFPSSVDNETEISDDNVFRPFTHPTLLITFTGCLLNIRVVLITVCKFKQVQQNRSVILLIAHLAFVSTLVALSNLFNTSDVNTFLNVPGPACGAVVFIKSVFFSALPMNIAVIYYERLTSFREHNRKHYIWIKVIIFVWLPPAIFSIPSGLMTEAKGETEASKIVNSTSKETLTGQCLSVNLFGSPVATFAYEFLRFSFFHLTITIGAVWAIVKIRSKMAYLQLISAVPSERLRRKIRSVRLVYFHCVSFILLWLPVGFLVLMRRTLSRVSPFNYDKLMISPVTKCFGCLIYIYLIISPSISLQLVSKYNCTVFPKLCKSCMTRSTANADPELYELRELPGNDERSNNPRMHDGYTSRCSTFRESD